MPEPLIANPVRARLEAGGVAIGCGVRVARGVEAARLMKAAGYDWIFIDLEHGQMSIDQACQMSVAALDAGIAPLVRVPAGQTTMATRCLDGGALGIVMPHVDTAEQARAIADAFRFPPDGHRSVAGAPPQLRYASLPLGEASRAVNAAIITTVMLETPTAVANAEAIAAVPGIDVLLVGCGDLSTEMGIPGALDDPRMVAALERVIAACRARGKIAALGGAYADPQLKRWIGAGMRMALIGNDIAFLLAAATQKAAFVRGLGAGG
jgi:2-keto-3-deoxy-L-rhamnonate aldolase RhmA